MKVFSLSTSLHHSELRAITREAKRWGPIPERTITALWLITMTPDLTRKKATKTKEAAKARERPREAHEETGDAFTEPRVAEEKNEESNGRETTGVEVDLLAKELTVR